MPRSRRRHDSASSSSASSDDGRRPSRSTSTRRRRSPPPSRSKRTTASYSLDKGSKRRNSWDEWPPRYDEEGWTSSSDESGGSWTSGNSSASSSSDSDDGGRGPSPAAAQQKQTRNCLVLFLGVSVALCLVLLGGFAMVKYWGDDSSSDDSGGSAEPSVLTVTVTASDGKVSTKVSTETPTPTPTKTGSSSQSSGSSSSGGGGNSTGSGALPGLSKNNIGIGFLPDYTNQHMADITDGLGIKSSFYGWYAQLPASGDWDGSQLTSQMDDIKACNCIFQPAVMPTKGWSGLTKDDNSQAKAIATVMKKFTDEGIEVWLRYYISDGTYQGSVDDFKAAWAEVAAAVADNDMVKMFFTPNVAGSLDDYVKWMPADTTTIDYLGVDYYPRSSSESFVDHMQPLYDKYCSDGSIKFAMGETGTMWVASIDERLAWLDQLTSEETAKAMPHYVGISWFNYDKEQDFRLWLRDDSSVVDTTKSWISKGTVASGASMGNG
ncbi:hypothetical protein JCM11641_001691 [Rhodosporidiobolus odoratus]